MYLKISEKKYITEEWMPIKGTATIVTISDKEFSDPNTVAEVSFNNDKYVVRKSMNAWLTNDEGVILSVINRDYIWS
ncbi:hypothetical protein [Yersinia vastinensis]|uniref:hypothetical protein n=1 Tax=Yersinia vastinensis TaxID=2890318 RepID=UPI0005E7CBB2|nr:hypothetical protein [Yersinia vastinensis]CNL11130.1 Uncharacterised protein [Yersinia frederiksenii]